MPIGATTGGTGNGSDASFTDPLSQTGFRYPAARLAAKNETIDTFFRSTLFTGSHDRSMKALQRGMVDGAAVMNLWFDRLDASVRGELRVIEEEAPHSLAVLNTIDVLNGRCTGQGSLLHVLLHVCVETRGNEREANQAIV